MLSEDRDQRVIILMQRRQHFPRFALFGDQGEASKIGAQDAGQRFLTLQHPPAVDQALAELLAHLGGHGSPEEIAVDRPLAQAFHHVVERPAQQGQLVASLFRHPGIQAPGGHFGGGLGNLHQRPGDPAGDEQSDEDDQGQGERAEGDDHQQVVADRYP